MSRDRGEPEPYDHFPTEPDELWPEVDPDLARDAKMDQFADDDAKAEEDCDREHAEESAAEMRAERTDAENLQDLE